MQLSALNQIMTVSLQLTDTSSNQVLQNDTLAVFVQYQNITVPESNEDEEETEQLEESSETSNEVSIDSNEKTQAESAG